MLYGRRRRRRLAPRRRAILETLLPRLRIDIPETGRVDDPRITFGFPAAAPLWLEIGFGAGEHLAWHATRRRDTAFIGCEAFIDGVAALLSKTEAEELANVRVFPDDARRLVSALPDRCLDRVFVLFPDPWPKARHRKRRLVSTEFLDDLARAMAPGAELRLATDHAGLRRWMLARLLAHRAFAWLEREAGDWRRRPPDWPETRYERKARAAGRACVYLRFARREGPPRSGARESVLSSCSGGGLAYSVAGQRAARP